jgi:hypothetical protein
MACRGGGIIQCLAGVVFLLSGVPGVACLFFGKNASPDRGEQKCGKQPSIVTSALFSAIFPLRIGFLRAIQQNSFIFPAYSTASRRLNSGRQAPDLTRYTKVWSLREAVQKVWNV